MKSKLCFLLFTFRICLCHIYAGEPIYIQINPDKTIKELKNCPLGVNVNFLLDNDKNRPQKVRTFSDALKEMGTMIVRFPGGEKSDNYLWSIYPYEKANPQIARKGDFEWPYTATLDKSKFLYDFDTFMSDCKSAGAKANLVVPMDIYRPVSINRDGTPSTELTFTQALQNAVEWVKYTKKHYPGMVIAWSISNEPWLNGGGTQTPIKDPYRYGSDAAVLAYEMKKIDPEIKIALAGERPDWYNTALDGFKNRIQKDYKIQEWTRYLDYLDIHGYPFYVYKEADCIGCGKAGYSSFISNPTQGIDGYIERARSGLTVEYRDLFPFIYTETSALSYSEWDKNGPDTGHGLGAFFVMAEGITNPHIEFIQYWNTRWKDDNVNVNNLLKPNNELTGLGLAISILGKNLLTHMVKVTDNSAKINSYASYDPQSKKLNIFILNRDTVPTLAELSISNHKFKQTDYRVYKGKNDKDLNPSFSKVEYIKKNKKASMHLTVEPVSITLICTTLFPDSHGHK
ncbi:hypothetical protein [Gabonia massiliensis]|jgi:hypothetical protein|uniref:hypothetical protein n=1 Tax=Gabonia massiliensis TaxID=1686296 RepID=UPI0006D7EBE2|nr:hypothetical protein [Gabonia massiliensis]